jgi:hypothetical protein
MARTFLDPKQIAPAAEDGSFLVFEGGEVRWKPLLLRDVTRSGNIILDFEDTATKEIEELPEVDFLEMREEVFENEPEEFQSKEKEEIPRINKHSL